MGSEQLLVIIYAIALLLCIVLSFIFSSSDMAYGSVDILRFDNALKNNPKKSVIRAHQLAKDYDSTISTILLLNDTVNAGIDTLATLLGVNLCLIAYKNSSLSAESINAISENWGLIFSMAVLVFKIMFGEIVAKSLGKIYNFKLSIAYANMLKFFSYLLLPITFIVSNFGKLVTYPITHNIKDIEINDDDLHEMVDDIEASGQVDENQADLLHDTITYTTTEAYEIMTPRVDMYAIDIDDDIEEIINDPNLYHYSRVPVYQDTIDNIIGYVKTKTLMLSKMTNTPIDLKQLLVQPLRFPRSSEINDILKVFRTKKEHFALIMDEYGGVEGILTMEDILEEIVGDIWDEKDDPNALYVKISDDKYIVDGMLNLQDFCSLFELDYDELDTEYVTIGGFYVELLDDKFAKVNDLISYKNLDLKVLSLDKNGSIKKIEVKINPKEDEE
jgi:putative hemolysin